jgi:hypothetical protein
MLASAKRAIEHSRHLPQPGWFIIPDVLSNVAEPFIFLDIGANAGLCFAEATTAPERG